jgi:hypothetical protein
LIEQLASFKNGDIKKQLATCFRLAGFLSSNHLATAADPAHSNQPSVAPAEAISKLKEGNGRYTTGNLQHPGQTTDRRTGDLDATIKANVKNVVDSLRSSTPILKTKVDSGQVQVVAGYYSLDTCAVSFLDEK